jgi:hypothetical protein
LTSPVSFGLLVVSAVSLLGLVLAVRAADQRSRDRDRVVVRLHFPQALSAEATVAFLRALASLKQPYRPLDGHDTVVFELAATSQGIEHRLRLPQHRSQFVLAQLRAAVPTIGVEPLAPDQATAPVSSGAELRLRNSRRPLRTDQPEATAAAILAALQPLGAGEAVVVQWLAVPTRHHPLRTEAPKRRTTATPSVLNLLRWQEEVSVSAKEHRDKTSEPAFSVVGRVGARSPVVGRVSALTNRLVAVHHIVQRPGVALVRRWRPGRWVAGQVASGSTPLVEFGGVLNARELATVIAWPVGAPRVPGLQTGSSQRLEAPAGLATTGRIIGASSLPGAERPLALSAADSLHHLHLIGPTGVGKSTLLANLALGDLASNRAVVLIDPKGDLVRDVADRLPPERQGNVILVDPTDDRPVGLNLLHAAHEAPERTADAVVAIFHRLFASSWGPRTSDVLHAALLTLAEAPGMTLCELPAVLTNDAFRRKLTARIDDQVLLGFWAWYDALSPGDRAATLGPVMNKLRPLLLRRRLRAVIGQADPAWQLDDVLNRGGVLLVNLSRGELGAEAATLLGSVLVAQLWQSIQRRAIRLPAMVLIDEFQDVVNLPTDLGEVLAQARGFGVGLTLAHQHLGQLEPRMRASVLANARTKVVFQAAADDAGVLAKQLGGGLGPGDLMGLGAHEAYLAACLGGRVLLPASLRTLPLPSSLGTYEAVRRSSRERFGQDREAVEAAMAGRQGLGAPAAEPVAAPQRRRRRPA